MVDVGAGRGADVPADVPRVPLRTGSLRTRTVVSVLAMLTVLLVALGFTVQLVLGERLRAQIEERLQDRAAAATALMGTVDSDDLAQRLSAEGVSVRIESADGQEVVAGPTPDQLRKGPAAGLAPSSTDAARPPSGSGTPTGPVAEAPTPAAPAATPTVTASSFASDDQIVTLETDLSDGSTLTLTADAHSIEQTLVQLRWVMAGASAIFLMLAAVALVVVVRASLRPLESMTGVARSIARGNRGQRLRPERTDTEIGRVALAFDEMLDGVEGAEHAARLSEGTARSAERAAVASEQTARNAEHHARDSEQAAHEAEETAREAEKTARAAEERVRNFVSDAAHELRTPVAGMQAAADTLVRSSVDRSERDRLASHVVREAGRASRLIDDMLMMARVDRGLELEKRLTDVALVVADEAERQRIRHPTLHLDLSLPNRPLIADVDPERLAQVVANLVDNASRMTGGTGPVSIRLTGAPPALTSGDALAKAGACSPGGLGVAPATAALLIEVSDAGPGVPVAERERIFDRLVRLDDSRRAGAGAGLGLPIARGIARSHGGDLTCEPPRPTGAVGTGTGAAAAGAAGARFVVTLPG